MVKNNLNFSITNKTKSCIPPLPFNNMKEAVLGKNYELSLVIVGKKKIRTLNRTYRNKNKPTDILSFPLSKISGEIFINPNQTKIQAKLFDRHFSNFVGFLFIPGLLHLKGLSHRSSLEKEVKKIRVTFGV